jgi:hypothetical protein
MSTRDLRLTIVSNADGIVDHNSEGGSYGFAANPTAVGAVPHCFNKKSRRASEKPQQVGRHIPY